MGSAFKRGEKVIVPSVIQVRDDGSVATLPTSPSTALTEKPSGARAFKPGDNVIADSLFQVKDDGSADQDSSGLVNPMTGLGDLIIGGIAGALRRLAPATVGQVLTLAAPGVPAWAAAAGGGGITAYNFNASASFAVTDAAAFYDLADLTIANVAAGTYLVTLAFDGSNKAGEVRVQFTDAANTPLWPINVTGATNSRHNGDNYIEYSHSFIVVLGAVTTVKVRAAAVAAIGNFTLYDRHLTMIKIA